MQKMISAVTVLLAAFFAAASYGADRCAPTLRVGTYNIRLATGDAGTPNAWTNRCGDVVALIRKLRLDAFGLQEVRPEQAEFLRKALDEFEFVGEHREADRKSGEASPVFYRKSRFRHEKAGTFWLSETPDVPGRKGWGAACPRVCSYLILRDTASGRRLCFANVHTDHVSALARKNGMMLVIRRMKEFGDGAPIVFVGDHNCNETEAPALAVAAVLRDAVHVSETPPRGAWRTFNGWRWREKEISAVEALKLPSEVRNSRKGSPCGSRIDYVYVSPGIRVLDCVTVDETRPGTRLYPSDHFPVVATIALP